MVIALPLERLQTTRYRRDPFRKGDDRLVPEHDEARGVWTITVRAIVCSRGARRIRRVEETIPLHFLASRRLVFVLDPRGSTRGGTASMELRVALALGIAMVMVSGASAGMMLEIIKTIGPGISRMMDNRDGPDKPSELDNFITGFGDATGLRGGLAWISHAPHVIIPALMRYAESVENDLPPQCAMRTMCEANRRMVEEYGTPGHIIATVGTELVCSTLDSRNPERYEAAVGAGQAGRNFAECMQDFPDCPDFPDPLYSEP
ncbi:unnamed protein product [Darwinula stevensoni]|uniref:Uncharacterized protein n=1 Tax=Darwinula stevensoni TaxID=69355 RepID=A0A7R8ZZA3_9CRUS|nr:unnamed protein product [Darwinula stevensoni]CAG0882158.1 unnamed protein product [Darwinula stevensoni]